MSLLRSRDSNRQAAKSVSAALVLLFGLALVARGNASATPAHEFARVHVGVGRTDITWHLGHERLGATHSDPGNPPDVPGDPLLFPGLHSRLYAKAIVVDAPGGMFAVVSADLVLVTGSLYESVAQRVEASTGIAPERLLVAATHTHSGNNGLFPHPADGALFRSFDPREKEFIADRIAMAVELGADSLRPATLAVGSGNVSLPTYNRRYNSNDPGRIDPELGVLRIDDAETNQPLAVIVNYGIHPVVLHSGDFNPITLGLVRASGSKVNRLASSDLVGFAERGIERALAQSGKEPMAMWLNGAEGDQLPVYVGNGSSTYLYSQAEWIGSVFAAEGARVASTIQPESILDARVAEKVIPLPRPGAPGQEDLSGPPTPFAGAPFTRPSSVRLQAIEFATESGKTVLMSWPGEPIRDLGVELKQAARELGFAHAFVVGLANDWAGYWLTPAEYDRGGQERTLSFYGRNSARYVQDHILDLAAHLAVGDPIDQVPLPLHAQADRATETALARAGIATQDYLGVHAAAPDGPIEVLNQPSDTVRPHPVRFTWRGGSPEVNEEWVPRVSVQRCIGNCKGRGNGVDQSSGRSEHWTTVAREGDGEVLLWEVSPRPGDSRWTAYWQPLYDTPARPHRFVVVGRSAGVATTSSYEVVSRHFNVDPCNCLIAPPNRPASGSWDRFIPTGDNHKPPKLEEERLADGAVQLQVKVSYPQLENGFGPTHGFRLLPQEVTTGGAVIRVVRDGIVIDTVTLVFTSSPGEEIWTVRNLALRVPTEQGAFRGVWPNDGGSPPTFELVTVEDAHGNTALRGDT